jgi:hypothetical protein
MRFVIIGLAVLLAIATANACSKNHNGAGTDGMLPDGASCPLYQILCNGMCVSTSDPMNCGGCGKTCSGGQVCSAGGCSGSCLPGLSACNGTCVDTTSDNNNCGTCGHACPMGQGCVDSSCMPSQSYMNPNCANGGGGNNVGSGSGSSVCGIGVTSFTWSVCSCKDVQLQAEALLDAWDSTQGPYMPGQIGGGMGANNVVNADTFEIYGQLWAGATTGDSLTTQSAANVYDNVQSANNISPSDLHARHDAYVAGNISGPMVVDKTLYQSPGKTHGGVTAGTYVSQPVTVKPPCDCTNKLPVVDIVTYGKTHNDNATVGLDPMVFTRANHPARIDLPCGEYYLTGFTLSGAAAIVVHGHTVIFVDGNITADAFLTITLADSNATLDVFVSGTITGQSEFKLGSPNWPALTHVYLGTTAAFELSSLINLAGNIWAGYATVSWTSDTDMFGSLFANDFQVTSALRLHYDRAVTNGGSDCQPPGTCTSCKDCNNQACNNGTCGACTTNADCCSPLYCYMGQCVPFIQ